MSPRDTIERVVDVLQRADSLFASAEAPAAATLDKVQRAAEASHAAVGPTGEMAGSLADAHHETLASVARRLDECAASDAHLVEQLARAADSHAHSAAQAGEVASRAAESCETLGEWSEIPAAEIAALMALRRAMTEMQALMTQQAGESMRTAENLTNLSYE
ncbi:hypothetical protein [Mycobacterium sp. 236(2023)]|uniref:hypothetical protein n=1 Tax=Mycobacterium sp. 236(2023) TaxID=3038163 RepID=UPI0024158DD7|nr:hypothetical protein [Mycobacterium sp. 236(2023)]MDG4667983.1 hypothetical protein [Mycobacterium sp. 236(2023)]